MREFRVCHIDEISDPGGLEAELSCEDESSRIFVIKMHGKVYAYINSCPHTGVSLNWLPDQFLDHSETLIQCSMHGAQFRPADGYCVWGPCQGQSLKPVSLHVRDGEVFVTCK
ncbi:MAG: Rieske 2Fe-2S domain-containing protein [Thiohalophilus sp.]|jgi:nitrite reductase/ring-hydroxylating ferredoxin subunit